MGWIWQKVCFEVKSGADCRIRTDEKLENQPQKFQESSTGAQIGAQTEILPSELSPSEADEPPLRELCKLWPNLSPEIKRLLLLMARDGGKAK